MPRFSHSSKIRCQNLHPNGHHEYGILYQNLKQYSIARAHSQSLHVIVCFPSHTLRFNIISSFLATFLKSWVKFISKFRFWNKAFFKNFTHCKLYVQKCWRMAEHSKLPIFNLPLSNFLCKMHLMLLVCFTSCLFLNCNHTSFGTDLDWLPKAWWLSGEVTNLVPKKEVKNTKWGAVAGVSKHKK